MTDDIIGMREMNAVFSVTDDFGIDREIISVPLEKQGNGDVRRLPNGEIEIVVPMAMPIESWLGTLRSGLEALGFTLGEGEEG